MEKILSMRGRKPLNLFNYKSFKINDYKNSVPNKVESTYFIFIQTV